MAITTDFLNRILNLINGKVDRNNKNVDVSAGADAVIDYKLPTYEDSTWYRVYASGWVEQGGFAYYGASTANADYTIGLPKPMADKMYTVVFGQLHSSGGNGNWGSENYNNRTNSTISVHCSSSGFFGFFWEVKGMGAKV